MINVNCVDCQKLLAVKTYNDKEMRFEIAFLPGILVEGRENEPRIRCDCGHYLFLIDGRIIDE
ncbi:hypothetical protein C4577_03485 [Candidatus Parcubacteria bacterium]|nr:MAG: hypothetical protein C4577_03485 [Candidatus Parcubacteria bacterium]